MSSNDLIYESYWKRKQLIKNEYPFFPVVRYWYTTSDMIPAENNQMIIKSVRDKSSLLDVGAGDLRIKDMIEQNGYQGEYHTQDIGGEYKYTYQSLDEIERQYGAIVCLDVLEHLQLGDGLAYLKRLKDLLEPGGVLVIQTPNALCIRDPIGWDMTHVQTYNAQDLWSYLRVIGLDVEGYRVTFGTTPRTLYERFKERVRVDLNRLLRTDHAENLMMFARRPLAG